MQSGFEYLDHTADVQIHSWGPTLSNAFEQAALGMMGYMTELNTVEIGEEVKSASVEGEDFESLLFTFLNEVLYIFQVDYFVFKEITITNFDRKNFKLDFNGSGEIFRIGKHPQGTEVKAITYSAMKIIENPGKCEIFVIVDI